MKKLIIAFACGIILLACNNDAATDSGTTDSLDHTVSDDRNNRNTTVYDSATAPRQGGDTASYERMPNKITDSTPR